MKSLRLQKIIYNVEPQMLNSIGLSTKMGHPGNNGGKPVKCIPINVHKIMQHWKSTLKFECGHNALGVHEHLPFEFFSNLFFTPYT